MHRDFLEGQFETSYCKPNSLLHTSASEKLIEQFRLLSCLLGAELDGSKFVRNYCNMYIYM
jgi:hypothetical protein